VPKHLPSNSRTANELHARWINEKLGCRLYFLIFGETKEQEMIVLVDCWVSSKKRNFQLTIKQRANSTQRKQRKKRKRNKEKIG
jgi:hypothetical protein